MPPPEPKESPSCVFGASGAVRTLKGPESGYNAAEMARGVNLCVWLVVCAGLGGRWGVARVAGTPLGPFMYLYRGGTGKS